MGCFENPSPDTDPMQASIPEVVPAEFSSIKLSEGSLNFDQVIGCDKDAALVCIHPRRCRTLEESPLYLVKELPQVIGDQWIIHHDDQC